MKRFLFILLCLLQIPTAIHAGETFVVPEDSKPNIISREVWGANPLYNDSSSQYWKDILEQRKNIPQAIKTDVEIQKSQERTEKINSYLNENFTEQFHIDHVEYYNENGNKYAWPLKYSEYIDSIIIHHTHTGGDKKSINAMHDIHRYHSLSNQWGDIGYHFLIGENGEIYEGKQGGTYVIGAHSKYNNIRSVGIAVIGDYHFKGVNDKQYQSLDILIKYLTKLYGIDLSKQKYYHMNCGGVKCNTFPIETYLDDTLSGHRDTGHTDCPGDELYKQLQQLRIENLEYTKGFTLIPRNHQNIHNDKYNTDLQNMIRVISQYTKTELVQIQGLIKNTKKTKYTQTQQKKIKMLGTAIDISLQK